MIALGRRRPVEAVDPGGGDRDDVGALDGEDAHRLDEAQVVADEHAEPAERRVDDRQPLVARRVEQLLVVEEVELAVAGEDAIRADHRDAVVDAVAVALADAADDDRVRRLPRLGRRAGDRLGRRGDLLGRPQPVARRRELGEHDEVRCAPRRSPSRAVAVGLERAGPQVELGDGDRARRYRRSMSVEAVTSATALAWLASGRRVVAATLVEVLGSAPLPLGATMWVHEDGGIEGSVTGGCVEGALAEEASAVLGGRPPRVSTFGISDELAGDVGPHVRRDRADLRRRGRRHRAGARGARRGAGGSRRGAGDAARRAVRGPPAGDRRRRGDRLARRGRAARPLRRARGGGAARAGGLDDPPLRRRRRGHGRRPARRSSTRSRRRRGWRSSARSTSPPRSHRWPASSATT